VDFKILFGNSTVKNNEELTRALIKLLQ
jgi:hypothetical protein